MRRRVKHHVKRQHPTHHSVQDIAQTLNPVLRGMWNYFGVFYPSAMRPLARYINECVCRWACKKWERLRRGRHNAHRWLRQLYQRQPKLFFHWMMSPVT
jgi:RNA-directed DNA polymerase